MRVFPVVSEDQKLSYEETLTECISEARKYGVGILLACKSVKDFDPVAPQGRCEIHVRKSRSSPFSSKRGRRI